MTERERLIELLLSSAPHFDGSESPEVIKMLSTPVEEVVDYLLAHGVKIPVRCEECVIHNNCIPGDSMMICGIKDGYCAAGKRRSDNV